MSAETAAYAQDIRLRQLPRLSKPVLEQELVAAIEQALHPPALSA